MKSDDIFEPCDFCDAPAWFPVDEHGNSTACSHCKYGQSEGDAQCTK